MGYLPTGAEIETDSVVLRRVDANVSQLVADMKADEKRRKITFVLTVAGVLFAAAKLGIIAMPRVLEWRRART